MSLTIKIRDGILISGLTSEQCNKIEEDLTYDNPKYAQIKKYSRYSTTREPKYIEYFSYHIINGKTYLKVPIGYTKFLEYVNSDLQLTDYRKIRAISDFPDFSLKLRKTQEEAFKAFMKHNVESESPFISGSVQLPTGKGKTILGLSIAAALKVRTLIVVHKTDLVNGWKDDIAKAFNSPVDVGVIKAKSRKVGKHFTIATIQTLNNLSPEELETLYNTFGFVIQDEMHHCPATTFTLVNDFKARYRLGLSATPERSDGLTHIMKLFFGDFCYRYDYDSDEAEEDILPVKVIVKDSGLYFNPVLSKVERSYTLLDIQSPKHYDPEYTPSNGEIRVRSLPYDRRPNIPYAEADSAITNHGKVSALIINDILFEYNKGHSCIVFFKQVNTMLNYENLLKERGVPQEDIGLYYGGNNKSEEVKLTAENKRKYITLATYSKATEGTNVKQWEVAFLVSSINDGKNVEQALGRIRRVKNDGDKISPVLVYDYRYSNCYPMYSHGRTRDQRYSKLGCDMSSIRPLENKRSRLFDRGFPK